MKNKKLSILRCLSETVAGSMKTNLTYRPWKKGECGHAKIPCQEFKQPFCWWIYPKQECAIIIALKFTEKKNE